MAVNYKHPEWEKVAKRLAETRAFLLEQLAQPADETKTAAMRGKIAMLTEILNWPDSDEKPDKSSEINFL